MEALAHLIGRLWSYDNMPAIWQRNDGENRQRHDLPGFIHWTHERRVVFLLLKNREPSHRSIDHMENLTRARTADGTGRSVDSPCPTFGGKAIEEGAARSTSQASYSHVAAKPTNSRQTFKRRGDHRLQNLLTAYKIGTHESLITSSIMPYRSTETSGLGDKRAPFRFVPEHRLTLKPEATTRSFTSNS